MVDYHQTTQVDGITFTGYAAGHVLGAAMFNVEIDGVNVMYTGDYSMEEDRHLPRCAMLAMLIFVMKLHVCASSHPNLTPSLSFSQFLCRAVLRRVCSNRMS